MGIFDGILLAVDMDGTLTDSRGEISEKNAEAIKYFQQNGGLFTVASGRPPRHFDKFADIFVPNTYIISLNGSVIFDPKTRTAARKYPLPESVKADTLKIASSLPAESHIGIHSDASYFSAPAKEITEETFESISGGLYDIMFMQNREHTEELSLTVPALYPEYKFARGWSEGLEMFSLSAGKGNALLEVKRLTGSRLAVSAGNYDNDLEMIEKADIGVAVANASPRLKASADVVIVSCDENAIAAIIEMLEEKY
ncbi:MAG: HAD-IIB family hydrolase [Clostridia bacterium]|nr:HAD-IIB family hydrolase [Clostridia bacterium]